MRVLFVNHSAAPDHLGGSELSLLSTIDLWSQANAALRPVVVSPSMHGAFADEVARRGWEHFAVEFGGWAFTGDSGGEAARKLRADRDTAATYAIMERLKRDRPQLVVTNTLVAPWGAFAAAMLGIPHVWFVREFADPGEGWHFARDRPETLRTIGTLSHRVIANSAAVGASLAPYIDAHKLAVSFPIVDGRAILDLATGPMPVPWEPSNADLRVTVVGRLAHTKGQWRVVEAIGLLARRGIKVAVCFVGASVEGQAQVQLQRRARSLGVSDLVAFVGEQVNPHPYVAASDVAIVASRLEAFGRSALEAHIVGKAVIAPRSGGSVEIVADGVTGFLVTPGSVEELAQRLAHYAADPSLVRAHGRAARVRANRFDSASQKVEMVGLLEDSAHRESEKVDMNALSPWLVETPLSPGQVARLARRAAIAHAVRRAARIARNPVAALRRWRMRRADPDSLRGPSVSRGADVRELVD